MSNETAVAVAEDNTPVTLADVQSLPASNFSDEAFEEATLSSKFLSRLQLMTSNSDKCKGGEFPINHFALIRNQEHKDLGESIDIIILGWRPRALQTGEEILTAFDIESDIFKQIMEKSETPDSGCMYGPEFLVWVSSVSEFATFFMGSKSARREAPQVQSHMHECITLVPKRVETKKFTWYTPEVRECSTPAASMPGKADLDAVVHDFQNPPAQEIELADEPAGDRER